MPVKPKVCKRCKVVVYKLSEASEVTVWKLFET
jgi:hypothetical protein